MACAGTSDDREIIGQIDDIILTEGVAESRSVTHGQVVYPGLPMVPNGYSPYHECGAISRSNTPGISIKATYFDFGLHPPGEWAGLNGSHGSQGGSPSIISPIELELFFDGAAAAGTIGIVEIAQNIGDDGVGFIPRIIGSINVYVIAPGEQPPITWFTVISDADSIEGNRLILDSPLLNGNPGNRIFVTHSQEPAGALKMTWPHPISVAYDAVLARWTVRNDDGIAMPEGIGFNIRIDPGAKVLIARRRRGSTINSLRINDPRANYNPFATIFVTPASPSIHPIAVKYVAPYWRIVHSDGAQIGTDQKFHVRVFGASAYRDDRLRTAHEYDPLGTNTLSNGVGIDIDGLGASRTDGDCRHLDFYWARGRWLPLIITANQTPLGRDPFVDANYSGVSLGDVASPVNRWAIRHENGSAMANNSSFNIWAPSHHTIRPPVTFTNTVNRNP